MRAVGQILPSVTPAITQSNSTDPDGSPQDLYPHGKEKELQLKQCSPVISYWLQWAYATVKFLIYHSMFSHKAQIHI